MTQVFKNTNELLKGGVYRSATGYKIRCLGTTPQGNKILMQYRSFGDSSLNDDTGDIEIGCYLALRNQKGLPFTVIQELEDKHADQDF